MGFNPYFNGFATLTNYRGKYYDTDIVVSILVLMDSLL